jgi:putative ABC transport system permease protein
VHTLWRDLQYGFRSLRRAPAFSIVAIITLGLGIGANTAIFSAVNAVLLRPLPYPKPERLVHAFRMQPPIVRGPVARPAYFDFRDKQDTFDDLAASTGETYNLTGVDEAERLSGAQVTGNFFSIFGVVPQQGRFLIPSDDEPGAARVAVISSALWGRRFGSDPEVVGKTISLNGDAYAVVGVAPSEFQYPARAEVWTVAKLAESKRGRGNNYLLMIGRLKDGVSRERAQAQMNQIAGALAEQYPDNHKNLTISVVPLLEDQVRNIRGVLWVLLGAVGLVLVIACANVANLLLSRAAARQREFAVRTALGARRWRCARQLLTESVLLAGAGGALAVVLAFWGIDLLVAIAPAGLPRVKQITLDSRVLIFASLVSLATGLAFGLAPVWQWARSNLNDALKEGSRGAIGSPGRSLLRRGLVAGEIALSLVLLISAGLFIGSIRQLTRVSPGFETNNLLVADIAYSRRPESAYQSGEAGDRQIIEEHARFLRDVEQDVAALPGVQSAGAIDALPVYGGNSINGDFSVDGRPKPEPGEYPVAEFRSVTPSYFGAMGIPLLQGRAFNERDTAQKTAVIMINQTLARRFFSEEPALGKRLIAVDGKPHEIVGVVGDARQFGLNLPPDPEIYFSDTQIPYPEPEASLVVRTGVDPATLVGALRGAVRQVSPDAPVFKIRTMNDVISTSVAQDRFNMILMSIFAAVALALAGIGLYGVVSYSVAQRTHEIGLRVALGARQRDVLGLVIRQGMAIASIGLPIGIALALLSSRLISSWLYGVSSTDAPTFTVVSVLLMAVALAACYIPARRAAKVDPMVALRYE